MNTVALLALFVFFAQPPKVSHVVVLKYPQVARVAHLYGSVRISATVLSTGQVRVRSTEVTTSQQPPDEKGLGILTIAAVGNLKQWEFSPCLSNCDFEIVFEFQLFKHRSTEDVDRPSYELYPFSKVVVRAEEFEMTVN